MMIDAFLPEGLTHLAVDSIFMAPQLGVLSTVHEEAATQVFERDCLIRLGAVVAPIGGGKRGQACVTVELLGAASRIERRVPFGEIVALLPLPESGMVDLTARPERGFDLGRRQGRAAHRQGARRRRGPDRRHARPPAVRAAERVCGRGSSGCARGTRRSASTRGRCDGARLHARIARHRGHDRAPRAPAAAQGPTCWSRRATRSRPVRSSRAPSCRATCRP